MTENSPNTPLTAGELEKAPGYVKEKIREGRYTPKPPATGSRARKEIRGSLSKIIKKAASITQLLTEHDQQQNLRVIRDAKKATHRIYDGEQKRLIEVPDHKTRLAAVALDLAYREGKPVEKSMTLHADAKDFPAMLAELAASSPAFQEAEAEMSSQKALEDHQSAPALPGPHQTKQHKLDGPPCGCAGPD
jgi:hypothetical protein